MFVLLSFIFDKILHVCWEEFCENIKTKVNNLEDLHLTHGEYVNKCLLRFVFDQLKKLNFKVTLVLFDTIVLKSVFIITKRKTAYLEFTCLKL